MSTFRVFVSFERRQFSESLIDLIRSEMENLAPPRWAENLKISDNLEDTVDVAILFLDREPSALLRNSFYTLFQRRIPVSAFTRRDLSESSSTIIKKILEQSRLWEFNDAAGVRAIIRNNLQEWISGISRESSPFPSGSEILHNYGDINSSAVDAESLELAEKSLAERGFVCLSGSLGAGKTTLGRLLLQKSYSEGLNPFEVVSNLLSMNDIEAVLTGPEDCIVFLDLDLYRKYIISLPVKTWDFLLSFIIRTTDKRRRLIISSSLPGITTIFDFYSDAHVRLPEPEKRRFWRLDQGKQMLKNFLEMNEISQAELILLYTFEPVVSESVFRRTLFSFWERLVILYSNRFPTETELKDYWQSSLAGKGKDPFRCIRISGVPQLSISDSIKLDAIEKGIRLLIEQGSPVIHALGDTLLQSRDQRVRAAGYTLALFYPLLSAEDRTNLLFSIAREDSALNYFRVFNVLFTPENSSDDVILGLCENLSGSSSPVKKAHFARAFGKMWLKNPERLSSIMENLLQDTDDTVRADLLWGLVQWGTSSNPGEEYFRLIEDDADLVKKQAMLHLGSRFPVIDKRELAVINRILEQGSRDPLEGMAWGLLNRRPEDYTSESMDLLLLLLEKLPEGRKGIAAQAIGGRLRFLSREVKELLLDDLKEQDKSEIVRCLLMNYSWLTEREMTTLWNLILDNIDSELDFASLVLRYFSIFDEERKRILIRTVLVSDKYEGREALGQLLARDRKDISEVALEVLNELLLEGSVEKRAKLPWFLLCNRNVLGEEGLKQLQWLLNDESDIIRTAIARALLQQGIHDDNFTEALLFELASDDRRSVRASAGEALGELSGLLSDNTTKVLNILLTDEDSFVRLRTLVGYFNNSEISPDERIKIVTRMLDDSSTAVKLEAITGLAKHPYLLDYPETAEKLARLLADSNEKVRLDVVRLVTSSPTLLASDSVRKRLPDLLLDRFSGEGTLLDELRTARDIQRELLPEAPPSLENQEVEALYMPAREVGGDYFDFFDLPDKNLGITVGDVVGKGIPAALTMASLQGVLKSHVKSIYEIDEIIRLVNSEIYSGGGYSTLVTIFYGVLELRSGRFTFVNAGHNPPLVVRRNGNIEELQEGGLIMGAVPDAIYKPGVTFFETGDVLVMYTDGITEAVDEQDNEFAVERLSDVIRQHRDLSAKQISSRIMDAVRKHSAGAQRNDDQTLIVVKQR